MAKSNAAGCLNNFKFASARASVRADVRAYTLTKLSLEKIPAQQAVREGLRCSFCNKEPVDDSDLVAGPHVWICDECIATCSDMLSGEGNSSAEDASDPEVSQFVESE